MAYQHFFSRFCEALQHYVYYSQIIFDLHCYEWYVTGRKAGIFSRRIVSLCRMNRKSHVYHANRLRYANENAFVMKMGEYENTSYDTLWLAQPPTPQCSQMDPDPAVNPYT